MGQTHSFIGVSLRATEDEMVGWHHRLDGYEFESEQVGDGPGNLVCCRPRGCKQLDTTE